MATRIARLAALAAALVPAAAGAHSNGIAGVSGLGGTTCNNCHSGGAAPTAVLDGPASVVAGATAHYTFTVHGGAAVVGGTNIAVDDARAVLTPTSAGLSSVDGTQLIHDAPVPFSGGALVFEFDLVAPPDGKSVSIYAAGNSCNGDRATSGDRAGMAVLEVQLTAAMVDAGAASDLAQPDDPTPPAGCALAGPRAASHPWPALGALLLLFAARTGRQRLIRRRRSPARSANPRR